MTKGSTQGMTAQFLRTREDYGWRIFPINACTYNVYIFELWPSIFLQYNGLQPLVRSEQQLQPPSGATFQVRLPIWRWYCHVSQGKCTAQVSTYLCAIKCPSKSRVNFVLAPVTNRLPIFFPQRDYNSSTFICCASLLVDSTAVRKVLLAGQPRFILETLPHIVTWLIFIFSVCYLSCWLL